MKKKTILIIIALVAVAYVAGRMSAPEPEPQPEATSEQVAEYTCAMHPAFRSTNPNDKCPYCGMALIPVPSDDDGRDDDEAMVLRVSERAAALMEIRTHPVERRDIAMDLRLFGKVDFDETQLADIVVRSEGYIEKLHANYLWQPVRRGEPIAEIYSPAAVAAMRELLVARNGGAGTLEAARARLIRLGVADDQIDDVLKTGEAPRTYPIISPYDGVVQMVDVREGQSVMEGARIVRLADVSNLWINLEAYEADLNWLATGQAVRFSVSSFPGKAFDGVIVYIDPVVNDPTRTARLRAEVANPDGLLKPGMFVTAHVQAMTDDTPLSIPTSAPLITGRRALVYVRVPDADRPTFEPREIVLGPRAGDLYIVREGLQEGDLVVVHGQFKIDSELQIRGRPSMMQPEGGRPPVHHHVTEPEEKIERVEADEALAAEIGSIVAMNFELVAALAGDDAETARSIAAKAAAMLTDMGRNAFADLSKPLRDLADETDIGRQRRHFESFSDALTAVVRKYGTGPVRPVYRAMCPMVEGRRGYWLQADKTINNPYFGASMLRCGEIEEALANDE